MRCERGQATVEWVAVVLLVAVLLVVGSIALEAPWLPRSLRCAIAGGCTRGQAAIEAAYGRDVASLVRENIPGIVYERRTLTLPVDFRRCRAHRCSDAPDLHGADVWRSARGQRATVFTHVVDRRPYGGDLYIQYWLYYPDNVYIGAAHGIAGVVGGVSGGAGRALDHATGFHEDDWESYQVRVRRDGTVLSRASAHNGYSGYNRPFYRNDDQAPKIDLGPLTLFAHRGGHWTPSTGWTRVSRGSHAGHLVDTPKGDRWTDRDQVDIVPLETVAAADLDRKFGITPPWRKPVYVDPARNDT